MNISYLKVTFGPTANIAEHFHIMNVERNRLPEAACLNVGRSQKLELDR